MQHKTSFLFVSLLTTKIQHPSKKKHCRSCKIWYQGTWEESHLLINRIIGRQTLVWAVEMAGTYKLVSAPLDHGWEYLDYADLGRQPQITEPLQKSRFPKERFQHSIREKKNEFGHIGEDKKKFVSATSPLSMGLNLSMVTSPTKGK